MKKILIIGQHFWPESFRINDIAEYFIENDCEVDVLCGIPNYPQGKFYEGYSLFKNRTQKHNGINISRTLEVPRGNNSNLRIFINYISYPLASLFHLPKLLLKKYDKILIYQLSPVMMSIAGILLGKMKQTETTMYVLDLWPENLYSVLHIRNRLLRKIATWSSHWHYKNVDKLIALSELMKSRLVNIPGINDEKVIVLPQACEKLYENVIIDDILLGKFSDSFNVVFTGNISPAQSFETVLDAAQILQKSHIKKIKWIIVGDGMSRKWLEGEVKKRKLSAAFSFEGLHPVEDIPKYAHVADVLIGCLVKSDLLEATVPAKVLSYVASGRPIVLAMDGEVQELINNKIRCGFAGPTEDAKVLANNIIKIYEMSDNQRLALGERAKDYHFKHLERNLILKKLYGFMFDGRTV